VLFVFAVVMFLIVNGCANSHDTGFLPGLGTGAPTVFPAAPSMYGLGGGITSGGSGGGIGQGTIYVGDSATHKILKFNATDNGNIAPKAILTVGNSPNLFPLSMAVNTGSGQLFILDTATNTVQVFDNAAGITGTVSQTASRSFDVMNGGTLLGPVAIALDEGNDTLYVAYGFNMVAAFTSASTATGAAVPARTIGGYAPGSPSTTSVYFRKGSDQLYISYGLSGSEAIYLYNNATSTSGNVSATAVLTGTNTGLKLTAAVAADSSGNIFAGNPGNSNLTIYKSGTAGNTAPDVTAGANATTLLSFADFSLTDGQTLFVADLASQQVCTFNSGSLFNQTLLSPGRAIRGNNTSFNQVVSVAHDFNH
jgi:hypothetical protein